MIERQLDKKILDALESFPVVYVNGPRQAGKSTLAQQLASHQWPADYVTFDEASMLGAADANPESFLRAYQRNVILDEVQMVPSLFRVLKILADEARLADKETANGRYLLTGSGKHYGPAQNVRCTCWQNGRINTLSTICFRDNPKCSQLYRSTDKQSI